MRAHSLQVKRRESGPLRAASGEALRPRALFNWDASLDHAERSQIMVLVELDADFIPNLQVRQPDAVKKGSLLQVPSLQVRPRMNRQLLVVNLLNDAGVGRRALLETKCVDVTGARDEGIDPIAGSS